MHPIIPFPANLRWDYFICPRSEFQDRTDMPIVKIVRFKKQLDRSDGPFDHPAELNQAVSFCNKNGIRQL